MNQLSEFFTLRQAAQYLGLALGTVRMYAWTKVIPSSKIGIQSFISHKCFADRTTLETVLAACKKLGVLKVKANHGPDVNSIVGTIANFRIEGNQVKGDLTLLKNSPSRDYVLEVAQTLASQIGLSIAFEPVWESKDRKEFVRCKTIYSADIVDAPAANPQGLFDASPTLTNTATVVPTGHKVKDKSVGTICPTCNAHEELLSKLATLHSDAANRLEQLCSSLEPKDNVSSVPTEQQFQARLNAQKLELEKGLEAKASIMAAPHVKCDRRQIEPHTRL